MRGEAGLPEADRVENAPHPRETMGFVGHAAEERAFLDAYRAGRMPHAWIIGGPEGIGKATLAWRVARFLLANPDPRSASVQRAQNLDVDPMTAAARQIAALSSSDVALLRRQWNEKVKKLYTEIRVDEVRAATRIFQHAAGGSGWRIAIIDSVDELNRNAANALLKIIEEPPAYSLFLLIAHRPGRILPTIRSRCRLMMLAPLSDEDVVRAMAALNFNYPRDQIKAVASRAGGSVKEALRLLEGESARFDDRVQNLLKGLPQVDWQEIHGLGDAVAGRDNEAAYESLMANVFSFLDRSVRDGAARGPARLQPYAEAWEKVREAAREAEILNLDKRPLTLSIFADLAAAVLASQQESLYERV
ncbi:MAG: polymerase subunit delta [Methylobacteriaceae bacterium]|nr:polymerase subunit delta [Methylobacteriaceae bacterium]